MRVKTSSIALAGLVATLVACGCEDDPIRVYDAPPQVPPSSSPDSSSSVASGGAQIRWTVPDSWLLQAPSPGGMGIRFATFLIGPDDHPVELTVTRLRPTAANSRALDNVNRWLNLMGLLCTTEDGLDRFVTSIDLAGNKAVLVDIPGPEPDSSGVRQRMFAAILPGVRYNWFVKTRGPQAVLITEKQRFEAFVRSIHFTTLATPQAPVRLASPVTTDIHFDVPETWQPQPASPMRRASFLISDSRWKAQVIVSAFPGKVGTALSNLNRWRGQVGLPPVEALMGAKPQPIEAANAGGSLLELFGPSKGDGGSKRLLVVYFLYGQQSWFIKMLGDDRLVRERKDEFLTFVRSAHFE